MATDLLALACGEDDPDPDEIEAQFGEAVPPSEQAWLIDQMSRSSDPDVVQVLRVLGRYHPDRRVAKLARQRGARRRAEPAAGAGRPGPRPDGRPLGPGHVPGPFRRF